MAVVAALATAETGHYEDENEHPQARRAETAQRLWKGEPGADLSGATKDEPGGTTGLFSGLAVGAIAPVRGYPTGNRGVQTAAYNLPIRGASSRGCESLL